MKACLDAFCFPWNSPSVMHPVVGWGGHDFEWDSVSASVLSMGLASAFKYVSGLVSSYIGQCSLDGYATMLGCKAKGPKLCCTVLVPQNTGAAV